MDARYGTYGMQGGKVRSVPPLACDVPPSPPSLSSPANRSTPSHGLVDLPQESFPFLRPKITQATIFYPTSGRGRQVLGFLFSNEAEHIYKGVSLPVWSVSSDPTEASSAIALLSTYIYPPVI